MSQNSEEHNVLPRSGVQRNPTPQDSMQLEMLMEVLIAKRSVSIQAVDRRSLTSVNSQTLSCEWLESQPHLFQSSERMRNQSPTGRQVIAGAGAIQPKAQTVSPDVSRIHRRQIELAKSGGLYT